MPVSRLAQVPWEALRAEVALPAIARVLDGAAAEREVTRALRAHPELARAGRTALVEAIFGVALWRRRLRWHTCLAEGEEVARPGLLLASLLRDLAGVARERALELSGERGRAHPDPAPREGMPDRLADRWSLPDWLESLLLRELGPDAEAFCAAISVPGPVCLRANRLRCTREELSARLAAEGLATKAAPLARDALFVETPQPNLFGRQAWRDGLFEPQDEGSQLLGLLVEARAGESVLDLCAGAGGKALLLAAEGARVLACDPDLERLARLRVRAARAGADIEVGEPRSADRVLVDAPCSELGVLRRGPDARFRLRPEAFAALPRLQRALLETAAPLARVRLVYATCTIRREENEAVAQAFERDHPEYRRVQTLALWPHLHGTDGFFAVAWARLP